MIPWRPFGPGRQAHVLQHPLLPKLQTYKREVARTYRNLNDAMALPDGRVWFSEKMDGETWFLHMSEGKARLLAPNGRMIENIPITQEAEVRLGRWEGLVAGELCARSNGKPPSVYELHAILGKRGNPDDLVFWAFDLVVRELFSLRVRHLQELIGEGIHLKVVPYQHDEREAVQAFFRSVIDNGGEGLVIRGDHGPTYKWKPHRHVDAIIVGYTQGVEGVEELLLGLRTDDAPTGTMSVVLIGSVNVGFTQRQRVELLKRLDSQISEGGMPLAGRSGRPYIMARPEVVVEVRCFDIMLHKSDGQSIRRWSLTYADGRWQPVGKVCSASLRDAVFVRVRDDKEPTVQDVGFRQIAAPREESSNKLPASQMIRREVYTRRTPEGSAVRKVVAWKTNKDHVDPAYPTYVSFFTDYSPNREEPLRTNLKTAASKERLHADIDHWLGQNIGRGWTLTDQMGKPDRQEKSAGVFPEDEHTLTIAFGRSSSPTFPIVRKRLDALAPLGEVRNTLNEKGKEVWFELEIKRGLLPSLRRILNLLQLVGRWKSTEVYLDGESLDKNERQDTLNRLGEISACWRKRKDQGPAGCRKACRLGCDRLRIRPSHRFLDAAATGQPDWFTVGTFQNDQVVIDKEALAGQLGWRMNRLVRFCPHFDEEGVRGMVQSLPEILDPGKENWALVAFRNNGRSGWVWPRDLPLPPKLVLASSLGEKAPQIEDQPVRRISPTTYAQVIGQNKAVIAVRRCIEWPMKHGHLFEALGAKPKPGGIILAGPPGTGKTLLARAVACETGAHLETINGPEILSKWAGASEETLRQSFQRARQKQPSVVLFDELDAIAGCRDHADSRFEQSLVAQLLTLLDGLEFRGGVHVLATTNRLASIDRALRRPGRFAEVVEMALPNEQDRSAILRHFLHGLKMDPDLDPASLATEIAAQSKGASGADLEALCDRAVRNAVGEALSTGEEVRISYRHFSSNVI